MRSLDGMQCIVDSPVQSSQYVQVVIYCIETRWAPRRQYIKVGLSHQAEGHLSTSYLELHGNEEGTVPATFQVIYMVSFICCYKLSSHSLCKCRLDGSLHRSSRSRWRGVQGKQVLKMSSNEEGKRLIVPVLPQPYQRCCLRRVLVEHYLEICALVSPHTMTTPSLWFPPI